nr:MAG TPA: hypothetical protein [Bacteriophage sp.]
MRWRFNRLFLCENLTIRRRSNVFRCDTCSDIQ